MNRWMMLCAGLALALLIGTAAYGTETVPVKAVAPVAIVAESTYTFSPVPEGTEVVHDFTIKNTGNAELRVEQVKTG